MKRLIMLAALPALLLAGCAAQPAASGTETLTVTGSYPLQYAQQFTIDECEGGYYLITIDGTRYLVVPEGENAPAELDADITVLQQPIESIYLVSSSAMDPIISIDGLDTVALSGTQADNWYLDAAKTAMENGQIAYAGKYSAPDYETILAANCGLAIENTMIYHTPEVKEQLEKFGVPVLVERSSYESGPLARMEWVKLYGVLLGKTDEAEQVFDDAVQRIAPLKNESATGKTVAFFSITSNNLATVRKGGDYVAKMIEMAGGDYVFSDLTDSGNNLATVNISLEDFYAGAKLAVALTMVVFLNRGLLTNSLTLILAAFAGAMAAMLFVLAVARRVQRMSILVICGVMIGYICSAITDIVVAFAQDSNIVNLHNWSMGSFSGMTWGNVGTAAAITLPCLAVAFLLSKPMAAYQMGESYAASVGVSVRSFSVLLVLLSSLLAACVTAFAGPISFVGIAVPHLVKQALGSAKPLHVLPGCALGGASFCLLCDLIARSLFAPTELSISSVTAVFGAPVVIWLLVRRHSREGTT